MPIEFENTIAKCHNCKDKIQGNFVIDVYIIGREDISSASGELVEKCAEHHENKRPVGKGKMVPQHSEFEVSLGKKKIGKLGPVPSASINTTFKIEDKETNRKFLEESRERKEKFDLEWNK